MKCRMNGFGMLRSVWLKLTRGKKVPKQGAEAWDLAFAIVHLLGPVLYLLHGSTLSPITPAGWALRNSTFGMSNYVYEDEPPGLNKILKTWVAEFKDDTFVTRYPHEGLDAWIVKHQDASDNIDIIAKRLGKVLDDLRILVSSV